MIIGISGKKQSGKDETYKLIVKWFKANRPTINVHRIAFADALKQEVARACGVTEDYLERNKESFRLILQGWGTDFKRRLVKDSYWIEKYYRKTLAIENNDDVIITPDVRFLNEYNTLKGVGAYLWRVDRWDGDFIRINDPHPSEQELDKATFDATLINETLQALEQQINNELNKIIK